MAKVSVAKLIESAIFNDAVAKDHTTMQMLEEKFDDLFIGNPEFIDSCTRGILDPIIYLPESNTVFNGHHRVLIAWLLNVEFIEYTDDWTEDSESGPELF
ncbi:ParB-like nuclease domain protein [Streptomyces phage Bmoc]|uniref:ParB-like nuclease domain protein n=1 Tax=Streptomyces phage Bmoc TaxID=2725629 RepID=A0A6M3TAU1_9CAUD|nr:ParB-like nuclease domain protein [Streptomyces phage Bmoc]YP_010107625.1 ParB-like nuclease domain protein [Streptomyces phage Bmoc]QJD50760.1 ParB-like nuclease domain protein [Streptomyces phage Bmoc]QJD50974.1 ParB-like nuclease domain protein [Streptomyces phage Bmoc]